MTNTDSPIFGKVFGWCDTTEEQARFTLHSHILLFIALFDALITLLWSNCEKVREEAQKELVEFLKKTMSSTYDLVEEDFIHETLLSTSNVQDDDNKFLPCLSTFNLLRYDRRPLSYSYSRKLVRYCMFAKSLIKTPKMGRGTTKESRGCKNIRAF